MAAQHIEVTGTVVIRDQMHPRLQDNTPLTVRPHGSFDRRDDVSVRDVQCINLGTGQEAKPQLSGGAIRLVLATSR